MQEMSFIIAAVLICLPAWAETQVETQKNYFVEIKKTVVFLGKTNAEGKREYSATGFLVDIQNSFHLITAKHAVVDSNGKFIDDGMRVFFNLKNGKVGFRSIDEIKKRGFNWIFHENKDVDIAIIPFGLDVQDDVKVISDSLFLSIDGFSELYDIFFFSYQLGTELLERISPIARSGIVSLINNDKTFYIDAFAFPGSSGSPVFLKPAMFEGGKVLFKFEGTGDTGGKFIGIIGEYLTYQEIAISTQTGRARVLFEENTGLSKVWSVTFIKEIMESDTFTQQLDKVKKQRTSR